MESSVLISKSTEMMMESKEEEKEKTELFPGYKKIDFQPARRQFTGFTAVSSSKNDFRIETLNPRKRAIDNNLNESSTKKMIVDRSDLKGNGLDSELSFRITFRKIGAGLENVGNTCFLNAVLQCLTYTEPLAAYLQSGKHQTSCRISGFCALCAIQKHVIRALQSTGRSLVPKDLVTNLRCISRNFKHCRQQDAHEYMVNLLESMHKCCLPSGVPSESPAAYEKSLVHRIFGGRLRSQVECQQCLYSSNKFDPFLDLSLDIVKADSLCVALRNFTAAELLDGGGKHYQCQKCKQKVRAKKRLTIHDAPNVLAIHLKRFYAHDPGRKIDKKVSFNPSLDMKPFVTGSYEGDLKYSLYGVLVHYGHNTHSGHYVCYVRTSSGAWHYLNDHNVRLAKEQVVLEQKAYMLFYVRDQKKISPRKPGDAFHKENLKHTIENNFPSSVLKQTLKEHVIGSTKTLAANASASVAPKDLSTSMEIPPKKEPDSPASDCPSSKSNPTVESSSSTGLPLKEVFLKPDGECLPASASFTHGKGDIAEVDNVEVTTGVGVSDCDKASSDYDKPQNLSTVNMVMCEPPEKINLLLNERVVETAEKEPGLSQSDVIDESCNKVGVILNQNTAGESGNQTGDSGQQIGIELAKPLVASVTPNECLPGKAPDCTPHKKSKKLLKHKFSPMYLSLKIFRPAIGLQQKNRKKCRSKSVATKNLMEEQLLVGISSLSDIGPSASEMSVSASSSRSPKVRVKSHSKCCGGDTPLDIADEEFKKRTNKNGEAADRDGQLRSSISMTSEINQHKISLRDMKEIVRENASNNEVPCILTQGLQETTVGRWDGIELLQPRIVESYSMQNSQIGYIPDEWDEEYDRGKRKKVKQNKHYFGGSNPFQDFASKKRDHQKAKMDSSSSGNQPFRI